MDNKIYDLIIVGAGPAGLSASIYASRYKLDHLIIGKTPGGQITEIREIENYPGFVSISGQDLISKFVEQVENYGIKIQKESVADIKKLEDGTFEVDTGEKKYKSKSLILTMGTEYRKINIPGEKEFLGKGVSYCATCDAFFFRNKTVCVLGGGNSAAVSALELSEIAQKVYLIFRKEKMTAEPFWEEKIHRNSKIEIVNGTNVIEVKGNEKVEKVILDKAYNDHTYLDVDGVFVEIGSDPGASLAMKMGIELDEQNYVKTKEDQSTNIPGVYAAGDITTSSNKFRQVLTAASEGAIAAASVYKFVKLK